MHVYILETMAFHIASHLDSDSSEDFTFDGSIAQVLLSQKYLREGIVSVMEIFGASAATTDEEFERLLRDVTTFSSFMVEDENTDDWLVGHIATSGLTAWAQSRAIDLHKIGRPSDYPWHVVKSRWLSGDVYRGSFSFKHYLHEHLHPSLMDACRFIEEVMCKFDHIIRNQLKLKQKDIEEDSFALKRFCDVGCYSFAMVVAVSRASRSYCIGLKNGDLESMLIYPEFEETEDLTDVEKFAGRVRSILKKQCNFVEWDKNRCIPEEVKFSLKKIGLYSMSVPQQYGGLNLNNKAKSRIYAELGCDLTLFASAFVQNELICETLIMFGSEEQKRTYLPMLAAGDISGAFCLHEHACGQDIAAMRTESVENCHGAGFKLNGQKSWVTNGALADLLVVFAKVFSDPSGHLSAFLVDRRKIEGLNVIKRQNTIGLRGLEIVDLVFEDVIIPETAILGNEIAGFDIANSIVGNNAFLCQFVTEMNSLDVASQHCNKRKSYGRPLSESNFIRERLANLAMHVYILETMAFYIAGHLDSDSSKDFTVEGSIAQLLSRKYLREGIVSVMEIFGASAATTDEEFERLLRDVTTFSSFMNTDDWLVGHIATSGLTAWAQSRAIDLHKIGRPSDYPWHVVKSRWLSGDVYRGSFSFKHYLHEHLHPSLMDACRFIEEVMCKFDHIIRNQLKLKQKDIEEDSFALKRFCDVGCYLFAMVVAVSRASRSYCIGLKNGDLELVMQMVIQFDPAMKQFLLHLDEKMLIGFKFIIRDIDETHVFITSEAVATLMQRIDALMESLSPDVAEKS
ncbi:Acyl-CoA dehydrogenase family member 9, mitochondrial [Trichinella sp. T8]|nr:Acyl-CoA dehydrogenase family member 9, mitochondrial [Trichinella sp. T8]